MFHREDADVAKKAYKTLDFVGNKQIGSSLAANYANFKKRGDQFTLIRGIRG
jgi:hypothetical protein